MKEANVQNTILKELSLKIPELKLFRNHTGKVKDQNGVYHTFGLCLGSADIIGWYKGRFVSIEVKTEKGVVKELQKNWLKNVNQAGGFAIIARSTEDALLKLKPLITGDKNGE